MSRNFFLAFLLTLLPVSQSLCPLSANLAIGSYTNISWIPTASGEGVTLLKIFNSTLSRVAVLPPTSGGENPTYLAVSPPYIFAANSNAPSGAVTRISYSSYAPFVSANQVFSQTPTTTHISMLRASSSAQVLVTVSFAGFVSSYISNKGLFELADSFKVPLRFASQLRNPELSLKQAKPHPHMALPYREGALIIDIGADMLLYMKVNGNNGKLSLKSRIRMQPGDGPRHAVLHPKSETVYVVNEISMTVAVLRRSCGNGILSECSRANLLDGKLSDNVSAAAIRASSDGRFLYASVRYPETDGLIAGFELDPQTGSIKRRIGDWSSRGVLPRDIFLFGPVRDNGSCRSFIAIVNRGSDNLVLIERDPQSGKLASKISYRLAIGTPASVVQY